VHRLCRDAREGRLRLQWEVPTSPPPPVEKDTEVVKRAGGQTWQPQGMVRAACGVSGDAAARGDCVGGGSPILVSFSINARLTLSADTDSLATHRVGTPCQCVQ
jgi:hypothetical protein